MRSLAGPHVVALEDLDDDGQREIILLSRSSPLCGNGACSMLVLRKSSHGVDTLFSGKVRVAKAFALTKETLGGYRALAALDAAGNIAVDDSEKDARLRKQLVYTMGTQTQMPAAAEGATVATRDGKATVAASTKRGDKPTLEDIVDTIAQPAGQKRRTFEWTSMEKIPGLKMRQAKDALIETPKGYRRGGQVALEGFASTSVTWQGDGEGADTADIRTGARIPADRYGAVLKQQFSASAQPKQIRGGCKGHDQESAVYQVNLPNRRPMYLLVDTVSSDNKGNTTIQVAPEAEPSWSC